MNYIYDVLLNFNENLYHFYDWNSNDEILHVRKIPFFKVDSKFLVDIKDNKIQINDKTLKLIGQKTDLFNKEKLSQVRYCCIVSDALEVIGLQFNEEGFCINLSKMLIDEEQEVIDVCNRIEEVKIDYKIIEKKKYDFFRTRKELEISDYINGELVKLEKSLDLDKIRYLSYECLNKNFKEKDKILREIRKELKNNWEEVASKLYDFFKLISVKNK